MTFSETMEAYALDPSPEHLGALHRAIMAEATYDPLVTIGAEVAPLARAGDHRAVLETLRKGMPGLFLSPVAHKHLSEAHAALGDETAAARERKFALLAMDSIRAGADGSEQAPYAVLRVEDEYTVLEASRRRSVGQAQVVLDSGVHDVHTVEDGAQVWFRPLWLGRPRS